MTPITSTTPTTPAPDAAPDTVTITRDELRGYIEAQFFLSALHDFGVDNWEWYGDAVDAADAEVFEALRNAGFPE